MYGVEVQGLAGLEAGHWLFYIFVLSTVTGRVLGVAQYHLLRTMSLIRDDGRGRRTVAATRVLSEIDSNGWRRYYTDDCLTPPTINFDVFVDCAFMVRTQLHTHK